MNGSEVATENPVFSPQGDAIAYDEPGPNSQNVFTLTLDFSDGSGDTNTVTNVSPNFATDEAPSWGPVLPGASTPESRSPCSCWSRAPACSPPPAFSPYVAADAGTPQYTGELPPRSPRPPRAHVHIRVTGR
jgi:hypothetical protein